MNRIIHSLSIEKIAMHGYGIGFAEGKAIFVPFTMPGDVIDAEIMHEKKDICFGTVTHFIKYSDARQEPNCGAFGPEYSCGGCDWLMTPYETQLNWKTTLIKEAFAPLQFATSIKTIVPSPQPQFYRNKSFLPAGKDKDGLCFGIFARYSHKVIPHKQCLLQPSVMDEILHEIVAFARQVKLEPYDETTGKGTLRHGGIRINSTQDEILLIMVTKSSKFPFTQQFIRTLTSRFPQITGIIQNINRSNGNVILGNDDKLLFGTPYLTETLGDIRLRVHYRSFLQINPGTTKKLYTHLKDNLNADDIVLDAFCGIGSIGLFVANKVKQVIGIEEVPEAITDADFNKALNNSSNISFHLGKVETELPKLMQQHNFTKVIFDPPRKGVEASVLLALAEHKIKHIFYVSCNPMTLVRDIRLLIEQGYRVDEITPFDMFPQTWHIETVVRLSL